MNSRDLFKKTHSAYESRQVFDGAYAVSAREAGQVVGACASLKAICSPDATDQDLWHVVHLDAGSRLLLDSVAVLGASGQDQAAEWAMQDFGRHMGAVGVIGVASGSAIALRRVLDDGLQRGRVTQALLDSAGSRVTAYPVRWLDGVGIASHGGSMANLFLDMVRHDEDGQLLDAMTAADLMEGAEQGQFDALIVDYAHLEMMQNRLAAALSKVAANGLSVSGVTATKPFKRNGVAQVAVMFDFSDGQTFTAFFHNPDSTPAKLAPKDILTSWKFTLNKRDVTAVVQPEQGENVQMPKLASRIMQLVAKNSDRFKRANARKGEMAAKVQEVQSRVDQKQSQLAELESDIADLQQRVDAATQSQAMIPDTAEDADLTARTDAAMARINAIDDQDAQLLAMYLGYSGKTSKVASRVKDMAAKEHPDDLEKALVKLDEAIAKRAGKEASSKASSSTPSPAPAPVTNADRIAAVNKSYKFSDATDEFKLSVSPQPDQSGKKPAKYSINQDYDPLTTAVRMDKAAKQSNLSIKWGSFNDADLADYGPTKGQIYRDGELVGRVVIGGDGKAMVYTGASGNERVPAQDGGTYRFSEDEQEVTGMIKDLSLMLDEQESPAMNEDQTYLQSIVDGTTDLSNGEAVEAELERIGENLTPELETLFEQAVDAYAAYQVQQASKVA